MNSKKPRHLSPEEQKLWAHVTQTIKQRAKPANIYQKKEIKTADNVNTINQTVSRYKKQYFSNLNSSVPIGAIDRKSKRRIKRGHIRIEATLDLHGFTQDAAHQKLIQFLKLSQIKGYRYVLVITGKGKCPNTSNVPGILRRMVPIWLKEPLVSSFVIGFEEAHRHHGGAGAIYIHMRRLLKK